MNESSVQPISPPKQSILGYAYRHAPRQLVVIPLLIIVVEIIAVKSFMATAISHPNVSTAALLAIIFPIAGVSVWLIALREAREAGFLSSFARLNNFTYTADGSMRNGTGALFLLDGRRETSHLVSGTYQGHALNVFLYQITIGSGKNQTDYYETVFEITLDHPSPRLLLIGNDHHFGGLKLESTFPDRVTIELEGNFSDHFTLYATAGAQIPALQVFDPDTMALLLDRAKNFNVEFIDDRIYIYARDFIASPDVLDDAFTLAQRLVADVGPVLARMAVAAP